MFAYWIHGLALMSDVALPGLVSAREGVAPDLDCSFWVAPAPGADGTPVANPAGDRHADHALVHMFEQPGHSAWRIRYADGTTFDINADARALRAYTPPGATLEDTLTYLYGPVLALVLRMRGVLALHASAVLVDGEAVLFVGGNGAGKSSLAAACAQAGFAVLSDDVVALRAHDAAWWASSSYDHLRLWPAAEEAMFGAGALPRITPSWDKRALPLRAHGYVHAEDGATVGAVFVLEERDAPTSDVHIAPIAPRDALLLLVSHAAGSRLMTPALRGLELAPLGRFITSHPPHCVTLPNNMTRLPAAVATLVRAVRAAREEHA
jgi:hypothetical protein